MPFLIPLIPVLTGAVTGLAATVAIGSAVVGGLGYITKDQDLMKIGGLLGIASLATGIAGAASAAEAGASEYGSAAAADSADFGVDPGMEVDASSTDFGVDPGTVTGENLDGGVTGTPATEASSGLVSNQLGQAGAPVDKPLDSIISKAMKGENNIAGQAGTDATSMEGIYDNAYDTQAPGYEDWYKANSAPQDPADGIINNLVNGFQKMGDRGQAALIQVGGNALASAFNDLPEKKYKMELEELRRRIANSNNIGMIKLGMNPTYVQGNKY